MDKHWLASRSTVDLIGQKVKLQMELEAVQQEIAGRPFTSGPTSSPTVPTAVTGALAGPEAPMHTFPSGAKRSELKPRYDLIPARPLRRLADRYGMGANLYGDYNWQKGMPLSDTFNHILAHLVKWNARRLSTAKYQDKPDDDLAAAAWGCFALMYFEETGGVGEDREDVRKSRIQGDASAAQRGRMGPLGGDGEKSTDRAGG